MQIQNGLTLQALDAREEQPQGALSMQITRFVCSRLPGEGASAASVIYACELIHDFICTTKLAPALTGEPIFVLRAQDKIAPSLVLAWSQDAARHDVDLAKSGGAMQIAHEMIAWQIAHPTQVKVPD
jgi:hypothetical protein